MIGTVRVKPPEPKRDHYGRPYVVPPQGGKAIPYTRCTTYVAAIEDMYLVHRWQMRHAARGIAFHPDLIAAVQAHDPEDKGGLNGLVDEALTRSGAGDAASVGTYVHSLTEAYDRGEDPWEVIEPPMLSTGLLNPDLYKADLEAYVAATRDLEAVSVEQFCVLDPRKVAGTPDRVVRYRGKRYIADLKTGNIEWGMGKITAQLAVYARSRPYDVAAEERMEPHGAEVDKGIVIHLRAGQGVCRLWWVDLLSGWEMVKTCGDVRDKRGQKFVHLARELHVDTAPAAPTSLAGLIQVAASRDELTALWALNREAWTADLTTLAQQRSAALQGSTSNSTAKD